MLFWTPVIRADRAAKQHNNEKRREGNYNALARRHLQVTVLQGWEPIGHYQRRLDIPKQYAPYFTKVIVSDLKGQNIPMHSGAYFGHGEHELPGGCVKALILLGLGFLLARLLVLWLFELFCFWFSRLIITRMKG